jgi:DNA-binding MarR family transcriptional regulator
LNDSFVNARIDTVATTPFASGQRDPGFTTNQGVKKLPEVVDSRNRDNDRLVMEFTADVLSLLSRHFGGDTTLNHLRIGNYIGIQTLFYGRPTSNKEIANATGISPSTVSRTVTEFIARGYIREQQHDDDGRINLISIINSHPLAEGFEAELHKRVRGLLNSYASSSAPTPF